MKKLLILGGSGFIGTNLTIYFSKKNFKVTSTYFKNKPKKIKGVEYVKCDLLNKKQVDKILRNKDILIIAAATTSGAKDIIERPYIHVTDNVIMNAIITRSAFDNKIPRIIFMSCTVMYKSQKNKIKENSLDLNDEFYPNYFGGAWMKVYTEKACEFFSRFKFNKYTIIRHSNIYGPYDKFDLKKSHVFGASVTKVLKNENGIVNVWGDGKEKRDLLFIDDLCYFVELAIKKQKKTFEIFNVGYGKLISINNLVKKIAKIANLKINIKHDKSKKSLKTNVVLNCDKANKILGWKVKNTIDLGIKKTLAWYVNNYISGK
jgi:GDP-L-fucose synthase